tara:strand:- start:12747 stop:13040 length:294 start_codon:yes stop_codon:yes gene_type:complete
VSVHQGARARGAGSTVPERPGRRARADAEIRARGDDDDEDDDEDDDADAVRVRGRRRPSLEREADATETRVERGATHGVDPPGELFRRHSKLREIAG